MDQLVEFLNSNFMTSLMGAGAGAWAGAYAAQRISDRARLREQYLKEIRNTNAAATITFQICNTMLALKSQYVRALKDTYVERRSDFEENLRLARGGLRSPEKPFNIQADFETLEPVVLPLEHLQTLAFDGLSLPTRPLAVTPAVIRAVHALNRTIEERNALIEDFRRSSPHTPEELIAFYFAARDRTGNTDNRYACTIMAIAAQVDDCIFFSQFLGDDLVLHGHRYRSAFRKKFRGSPPRISRVNFDSPEARGLMPRAEDYTDWSRMFVMGRPDHLSILSRRRRLKRRLLASRRKLRRLGRDGSDWVRSKVRRPTLN